MSNAGNSPSGQGFGGSEMPSSSNGGNLASVLKNLDQELIPGQVNFDLYIMNMASGLLDQVSKWVEEKEVENASQEMTKITNVRTLQRVCKFLQEVKDRYDKVVASRSLFKNEKMVLEGEAASLRGLYRKTLHSLKCLEECKKQLEGYVKVLEGELGTAEEAKKGLEGEARKFKKEKLELLENITKLEEVLKEVKAKLGRAEEVNKDLEEEGKKLKQEKLVLLESAKNLEGLCAVLNTGMSELRKTNEELKVAKENERKEKSEELQAEKLEVAAVTKQMELNEEKLKYLEGEKSRLEDTLRKEQESKSSLQKEKLELERSLNDENKISEELQEQKRKLVEENKALEFELEKERVDKSRLMSSLTEEKSSKAELSAELEMTRAQFTTMEKKFSELTLSLSDERLKRHEVEGNLETAKQMMKMEKERKLSLEQENLKLRASLESEKAELDNLKSILSQSFSQSVEKQEVASIPSEEEGTSTLPSDLPHLTTSLTSVKRELKPTFKISENEEVECITVSDSDDEEDCNATIGNKSQPIAGTSYGGSGRDVKMHSHVDKVSLPESTSAKSKSSEQHLQQIPGVSSASGSGTRVGSPGVETSGLPAFIPGKTFFKCQVSSCKEMFEYLSGIQGHAMTQHGIDMKEIYGCDSCGRGFLSQVDLLAHKEEGCRKQNEKRKREMESEDETDGEDQPNNIKFRSDIFFK